MTYKLEFPTRKVEKQFERFLSSFEPVDRQAAAKKVEDLQDNPRPRGCEKIKGNTYRMRFGDWRVVYEIYKREKVVAIAKIGIRREGFYKEFR